MSVVLLFANCKQSQNKPDYSWEKENLNRDSWQKPSLVIEKLGNIEGKVIGDVGAGTGYFAFRLAIKKAKVIALEIDTFMISLIEAFKANLPEEVQSNIETRPVEENDPLLKPNELDIAVIINTVSYIKKPYEYIPKLCEGIKTGGKILIVDYKIEPVPIPAPPKKKRIKPEILTDLLSSQGFKNISVDLETLDYQYIVIAEK